jgi:hypothetical protein
MSDTQVIFLIPAQQHWSTSVHRVEALWHQRGHGVKSFVPVGGLHIIGHKNLV